MSEVSVTKIDSEVTKAEALEAYNLIVEHADLLDIRLMDLKFSVKPEYFAALREDEEGGRPLSRSFDGELTAINYDSESKTLGGHFTWLTTVTISKKKLLKVEAQYFVVYSGVPEVAKAHLEAYLQRVGRFASYPYFRGLVAHLSWESNAELPVMPVIKSSRSRG
ncbi:hypothetical protein RsS62_50670 [Rhizobium dioscoreae]|uniref:hypothetical protein n=1 Tax=Rhizobium TaxID=379 RepID=UPI001260577B|nr:hypothetical protein [Rhizobium dioscoreae]GES45815.1 hypothetical protein RsS62_50670 [Rhizobium dioscoreae]